MVCVSAADLDNFDRRAEIAQEKKSWHPEQAQAISRLERIALGLRAEIDPVLGSPKWLGTRGGILSARVVKQGLSDEEATARSLISANAELFGFGENAFDVAREVKNSTTPKTGLKTVVWQQEAAGLPVIGGAIKANFSVRGELIAVSGGFLSSEVHSTLILPPTLRIDARAAVVAASVAIEAPVGTQIAEDATKAAAEVAAPKHFKAAGLRTARARLVWLPMSATDIRLCWLTRLEVRKDGRAFDVTVDAATGETLIRTNAVSEQAAMATYRVYGSDSPRPMSPGLAAPAATQAAEVLTQQFTLRSFDATASPFGWVENMDNATLNHFTQGNNALSGWDTNGDFTFTTVDVGTGLAFTNTPNLALAPSSLDNQNASATNAFYWVNWMHDRLHQLGFTESAGNFQTDNNGNGGAANDPVFVLTQFGADTSLSTNFNNASFSTDIDGNAPLMRLHTFTGTTPDRDSAFDNEVILHEYTHGLSQRMVGTGAILPLTVPQSRALGEGWSDFFSLSLLSNPGDNVNGNYAWGAYAFHQLAYPGPGTYNQNYYYGIRRFPYSTVKTVNPLLLRNTWSAPFAFTASLSPLFTAPTEPKEVHNAGEVWCVSLWDVRARVIGKYGHAIGNERMLQAAVDGMSLLPNNPTYVAARQTFVQAYENAYGTNDRAEIWHAFSGRGLGYNAIAPSNDLVTAGQESYQLASEKSDGGASLPGSAQAVCTDAIGQYYTAGVRAYPTTGADVLVTKHDAQGRKQWEFVWSGTTTNAQDLPVAISEVGGSLYVAVSSSNGANQDYVLLKLIALNGQLDSSWVNNGAGAGVRRYDQVVSSISKENIPTAMAISGNNIYVTGYGRNNGGYYVYLTAKWDTATGDFKWATPPTYNATTTAAWSKASAIAVINSTVVVTGTSFQSTTAHDFATIRYTDNGTTVTQNWVKRYNAIGNSDYANAVAMNSSGIFVLGSSISTDSPQPDIAVVRYTNNGTGTQSWVKRYDFPGESDEQGVGIQVDASSVYVIGSRATAVIADHGPLVLKLVESTGAFSPTWADVGDGVGVRVYQKGVGFTFKGVALSPVAPRMRALAQVDGRPWVGEIQASDGSLISSELFNDYGVDPMALAVSPITGDLMVVGADAFNYPTSYFSTTLILKGQDGP